MQLKKCFSLAIFIVIGVQIVTGQYKIGIQFTPDGTGVFIKEASGIAKQDLKTKIIKTVVTQAQITPANAPALDITSFAFSTDNKQLMVFTNTAKVWRYNTTGDYWVLDIASNKLVQLGKGKPSQSLMYAKFSPDGRKAAYVSGHNLFAEDIASGKITPLTVDG